MPKTITDLGVQALVKKPVGAKISDAIGSRGDGSILLRRIKEGIAIYYRHEAERKTVDFPVGRYHAKGRKGGGDNLTLAEAYAEVSKLALERKGAGGHSLRAAREKRAANAHAEEHARLVAELQSANAIKAAHLAKSRYSLAALLAAYWRHLQANGRESAADVKNLLNNHVLEAFPELSAMPAADIKAKQLSAVLSRLVTMGHGRTAGKARSYMRAAYALAIKAETDPTVPMALHGFGVDTNPADALPSLTQFTKAGERTLSAGELREYMRQVADIASLPVRAALLLALRLGGQRPQQLLRLTRSDIDLEESTIVLRDGKGARSQARLHVLPLTAECRVLIADLCDFAPAESDAVFTTDGKTGLQLDTLSFRVRTIALGMIDDKLSRVSFRLGDLRRTCETMLAGLGISKDTRAQLLSHGLSGVQAKNYDRHSYANEKLRVLTAWNAELDRIASGKPRVANVTVLKAREVSA